MTHDVTDVIADMYTEADTIDDLEVGKVEEMPLTGNELDDVTHCAVYNGDIPEADMLTLNCSMTAQYVMVRSVTSPQVLILCEVEVFGELHSAVTPEQEVDSVEDVETTQLPSTH